MRDRGLVGWMRRSPPPASASAGSVGGAVPIGGGGERAGVDCSPLRPPARARARTDAPRLQTRRMWTVGISREHAGCSGDRARGPAAASAEKGLNKKDSLCRKRRTGDPFFVAQTRSLTSALPSSLPCCCDSIRTRMERSEKRSKTEARTRTEGARPDVLLLPPEGASVGTRRCSTGAPKAEVRARALPRAIAACWRPASIALFCLLRGLDGRRRRWRKEVGVTPSAAGGLRSLCISSLDENRSLDGRMMLCVYREGGVCVSLWLGPRIAGRAAAENPSAGGGEAQGTRRRKLANGTRASSVTGRVASNTAKKILTGILRHT